jgi:hypothetical protein
MLKNPPQNDKEHFDKFFNKPIILDLVAELLVPDQFIHHLNVMQVPEYNKEILEKYVIPMKNKKRNDWHYGVCELLRRLFYSNPGKIGEKEHSWYFDFLFVCLKNVRNGTLLKYIDPKYHIHLG